MRNKKRIEVGLVREALAHLGLSPSSVCGCSPPFPDVFVTLGDGRVIGVEVTDYYSDATGRRGSRNRAFSSSWMDVQTEIRRQVERYPELQHITGWVTPQRKRGGPGGGDGKALARELVDFAAEISKEACADELSTQGPPFPTGYPLMNKYVAGLELRPTGAAQLFFWACRGFAGGFGLDPDSLTASIRKKEEKAYDWGGAEERWLLIAAGAAPATVASWVGIEWQEAPKLDSLNLSGTGAFDRVVFFASSCSCWAREVWRAPGFAALQGETSR